MRRLTVLILMAFVVLAVPHRADAWGFDVHKYIMDRAIPLLPVEIRPFFEKYRVAIVEHAVDPDLWRNAGWEAEPPRHFVDMDAYGAFPFKDLPHDYEQAVARYGKAFVEKNGTLPWRTEEMYRKLVEGFTQKRGYAREDIKFFSSIIAHYTADAHVPFHAALNYDGQLTQQWGIHSRFESELFERYKGTLQIDPKPVVPIASARAFIFDTLLASFPHVQTALDADKAAVAGKDVYDDEYFTLFFSRTKPILEQRLSGAITGVASMITAAWVEAGRLPLPLDVTPTLRKVRKQ